MSHTIAIQIALLALAAAAILGTVAMLASASNSRIQTASVTTQTGQFIYGISIADLKNSSKINDLEFTWMKSYLSWRRIEPKRGEYDWADLDKVILAAKDTHLQLLLRIDQAPDWSHPSNTDGNAPPDPEYFADWERFLREAATRGKDNIGAFEIWNEPNLAVEWGGKMPDPVGYSRLLQTAYWAIKQGDPNALVVSAGLARTDEQSGRAMDNVVFLSKLYDAGAKPYFDVLGSHPNGGAEGPSGSRFLKAEEERRIMEAYGDGAKKVWATEVFWAIRPPEACSIDSHWADLLGQTVDAGKQAQFLA